MKIKHSIKRSKNMNGINESSPYASYQKMLFHDENPSKNLLAQKTTGYSHIRV